MNDEAFIKELSDDIIEYYIKAKQVYTDSPELTLVFLRSYAYDLCGLVANYEKSVMELTTLFRRVEKLVRKRYLTEELSQLFHDIRKDANKGAHPEQFNISKRDYHKLALANLKKCCELTEKVYFQVKKKAPPPYNFIEPSGDSLKDLCYEALVNNDQEAQYLVGLILKSKIETTKQAEQLFELASAQEHTRAMYEYGCLLMQKDSREYQKHGLEWLNRAALGGCDSALSRMGLMYFSGTEIVAQNRLLALDYLERAAEEEHPEALTQLGAIYFEGREVEADIQRGFDYSLKGALSGYPEAQYNLALYYLQGLSGSTDSEKGIGWLEQSVAQNCSKAEIHLASILVEGLILSQDIKRAYQLYRSAIEKGDFEAMIEFALLSKDDVFQREDHLIEAAEYLQLAYEYGGADQRINEVVLEESPSVVEKLRQSIAQSDPASAGFKRANIVSQLFDEKGLPYGNRKK